MFRQSSHAFLYIAYATLTIGLLVTSLLSPLHQRTIVDRSLRVYGVVLVYDSPPPPSNWTPDPDEGSSGYSSSMLSSSALPSDSANGTSSLESQSSSTEGSSSPASSSNALSSEWSEPELTEAWVPLHARHQRDDDEVDVLALQYSQHVLHTLWNTQDKSLRDMKLAADKLPRLAASHSAYITSSSSNGDGDASQSTPSMPAQFRVGVRDLTHLSVGRIMVAYVAFAGATLVLSIVVIFAATIQLVPDVQWIKLSVVSVALFSVSLVCNALCVIMAAVLTAENKLYAEIAMGYYARPFEVGYKKSVRSGLSSAIASLVLSLISAVIIFLIQRE